MVTVSFVCKKSSSFCVRYRFWLPLNRGSTIFLRMLSRPFSVFKRVFLFVSDLCPLSLLFFRFTVYLCIFVLLRIILCLLHIILLVFYNKVWVVEEFYIFHTVIRSQPPYTSSPLRPRDDHLKFDRVGETSC